MRLGSSSSHSILEEIVPTVVKWRRRYAMMAGPSRESKAVARIESVNTRVSMMTGVDLVKSKKLDNGTEDMGSSQRGERGRLERDEGESVQPPPGS
jgi:hypothetical protein